MRKARAKLTAVNRDGKIVFCQCKMLPPNYDVFDEAVLRMSIRSLLRSESLQVWTLGRFGAVSCSPFRVYDQGDQVFLGNLGVSD